MKQIIIIAVVLGLSSAGCTSVHFADPHRHVIDVHAAPWRIENAPDARLVWVDAPSADDIRDVVTNSASTARAYILSKPWKPGHREHIQIQDLISGKVFELEGIPFEWRDYDDLFWVDNRYLVFDRWTHPHYGRHFVIDFARKKLILMAPFPDQFYLDLDAQNQKKQPVTSSRTRAGKCR